MFEFNDRLEKSMERFEAFFNFDVADRPPVNISLWKDSEYNHPQKKYDTLKEKWFDFEFRIEEQSVKIDKTLYLGDSFPILWPNMGPEIYSAWCGCG
jgi:hypothetical protein